MASNPRKFSEKIALHTQKQAEETAAFEQIMKEVTSAKPNQRVSDCVPPPYLYRMPLTLSCLGQSS